MTHIAIAKKAVHMIVQLNVAAKTAEYVGNHTDLDEDSITVGVGSMVVGHLVANRTDKYTDPIVEKTASKLSAMKETWKTRKQS